MLRQEKPCWRSVAQAASEAMMFILQRPVWVKLKSMLT